MYCVVFIDLAVIHPKSKCAMLNSATAWWTTGHSIAVPGKGDAEARIRATLLNTHLVTGDWGIVMMMLS